MDFTIEEISKQWQILQASTSSISEKKQADVYLTNFKRSPSVMPICLQLLNFPDPSTKILSSLIFYQNIKENYENYLNSKEKFNEIKGNLFSSIIPLLENCQPIVIDRICFSLSIISLIGSISYWPDAIEDILEFAKSSNMNCYIAITALANCATELENINFPKKKELAIKNALIVKSDKVSQFIDMILSNVNNLSKEVFSRLYVKVVELSKAWVDFEVNSLQMTKMVKMLLNDMNEENISVISEMFCKSIEYSKGLKNELTKNGESIELIVKCDNNEMENINYIISVVYDYVKQGKYKYKIIEELAKIISSITENFPFLFFLKNQISKMLYDLFMLYISYRKKSISSLFFETIHALKSFINMEYKLSNFTDDEKVQFSNFLIKVNETIVFHCKKKYLKLESDIMKDKISLNIKSQISNETQDIDYEENDIGLSDYRKKAEDIFFDIFLIFAYNFKEDGINFFLQSLMKIIRNDNINIYDENILKDENKLQIGEVVIFVLQSIADCFESLKLKVSPLLQFITYILHSKILENKVILVYFLLLLSNTAIYLSKEPNSYLEIILFLLQIILSLKELSKLSSIIILNITQGSKVYNESIFKEIYKVYFENYDSFDEVSIANLSQSLCAASGVAIWNSESDSKCNKVSDFNYNELTSLFIEIAKPATERIKLIIEMLNKGNYESNIQNIKFEIIKNYSIHAAIIKYAFFSKKENFLSRILEYHLDSSFNYTSIIFSIFNNKDIDIITSITKILIKCTQKLSIEKFENYYDKIIQLVSKSYISNRENYLSLSVISNLYNEILTKGNEQKKKEISLSFFELLKLINQNIPLQTHIIIDVLNAYAQFFIDVYPNVIIDYSNAQSIQILDSFIDFYLEALNSIIENELIKNIFRVLTVFIQRPQIELVSTKIVKILSIVFESIEHYSSFSLSFFTKFISSCIEIDKGNFLRLLLNIFENSQEYKIFPKNEKEIILGYLDNFGNIEGNVKSVLNDMINITKGMAQLDVISHYEIQLARLKITNKIN